MTNFNSLKHATVISELQINCLKSKIFSFKKNSHILNEVLIRVIFGEKISCHFFPNLKQYTNSGLI